MWRGRSVNVRAHASIALLLASGCHRADHRTEATRRADSFQRGDVVVVERTASDFFEGRVLSVADGSLKVQTTEDGEPVVVAQNDVYRVGAPGPSPKTGGLAICNDRPAHWAPCRLRDADGATIRAVLDTGSEVSLPTGRVLAPSPVTTLNIAKAFELADSRRRFDEAASGAGEPKRPLGWSPEAREPVIARRGSQWFSAHVASALADGGVRVLFEGSDRAESVHPSSIVPVPPYPGAFSRGDFALVRPGSSTEPWARVRIEGIGPDEAVAVGEDGVRRRYEPRQMVPVTGNP